jgi:hypothetical protein
MHPTSNRWLRFATFGCLWWLFVLSSRGLLADARQPPPLSQKRQALLAEANAQGQLVEELRAAGKLDEAIHAQEKRIDLLKDVPTFSVASRTRELKLLSDLQLKAEAFKAARETCRTIEALMEKEKTPFRDWQRTDARLGTRYVERVAAMTPDERQKLTTTLRTATHARELASAGKREDAIKWGKLAYEVLQRELNGDSAVLHSSPATPDRGASPNGRVPVRVGSRGPDSPQDELPGQPVPVTSPTPPLYWAAFVLAGDWR